MSFDSAISLQGVGKCYSLYDSPQERLRDLLFGRWKRHGKEFWALRDVTLEIPRGEVFGIVGRNGAGKSTLLQLVCGTVAPTTGSARVNGRVAALLELGAGFNPEFTGRENVFLNAAVLGLTPSQVDRAFDSIVAFADIGEHLQQPVKTYSSGMVVRLAFAVAVHVDPEILIIDEALSVGDGAFAKKSFDRIMEFKEAGKTILFCSHSLFQVESVCNRVLWLDSGNVRMVGAPKQVTNAYSAFLSGPPAQGDDTPPAIVNRDPNHGAQLLSVQLSTDGGAQWSSHADVHSRTTTLLIEVKFSSNPKLPPPSVSVGFVTRTGVVVNSSFSADTGHAIARDGSGHGTAVLTFPALALLHGEYAVGVYLMDERGIHIYDFSDRAARVAVQQEGREVGLVHLPGEWDTGGQ